MSRRKIPLKTEMDKRGILCTERMKNMGWGRNNSLTITSRAVTAFYGLEDVFSTMYCKKDFERILNHIKNASESARNSHYIPLLYRMLDDCKIEYEIGMENDYYESLIEEKVSSGAYDGEALEDRMILALFDRFKEYSTPSEYMDRILVRLQDEEDKEKWDGCSLRLRILKQFVKYGNYLSDAGYGSRPTIEKYAVEKTGKKKKDLSQAEIADVLTEDIFDDFDSTTENIDERTKSARKPNGKFGLLKVCDDLAFGKFRTQGGTKKSLYFLAMVLKMSLAGLPGADAENDIMKNLFRDYYNNNLMRFMTESYKGHLREFENPSGQGINFKNFAEMVYLYYIAKAGLEPQEKILRSSRMINDLAAESRNRRPIGEKVKKDSEKTEKYRERFVHKDTESGMEMFIEDFFDLPEEEFKAFLLDNYDCDTGTGETFMRRGNLEENIISAIQIDADQRTAYAAYKAILDELKIELEVREMSLEDCNYGLWFVDVSAYKKEGIVNIPDRHREVDRKNFDEFMEVLFGVNLLIGNTVNESPSDKDENQEHTDTSRIRIKALSVQEAGDITRASLMAAYYYYFNITHEENMRVSWTSYGDLFEEYKRKLDPILEKCGYQEISGKNLFDVVLTFSSYARHVL